MLFVSHWQRTARYLSLSAVLVLSLIAAKAHAGVVLGEPILGGQLLVAEDGYVTAEFLGSNAGYFNTLYLADGAGDVRLFDKHTPLGQGPVNLGWFTADTELTFRLAVRNTGLDFYSGAADRNPDGLAHVLATTVLDAGTLVTTVGFEDLLGGGDLDFNDFMFRLTNVIDPPPAVPAPTVLALLGLGLVGLGLRRRRR